MKHPNADLRISKLFIQIGVITTLQRRHLMQDLNPNLKCHSVRDFIHLSHVHSGPSALVINASHPYRTLADVVKAGKLRPLGVSSRQRNRVCHDMPSVAESGYPGFGALSWSGLSVAMGTPAAIAARLEAALKEVVSSPTIAQKLEGNGLVVPALGSRVYFDFVAGELRRWFQAIKTAGIKPR